MPRMTVTLQRVRLAIETVTTTVEIGETTAALLKSGKLTPSTFAIYGVAPTIAPDAWQPTFPRPDAIGVDAFKIED